uniref:MATH domain-containing protein n=1 Tax=Meloidogyne hapla TaxID=6305 RepID=A0A1I8BRI4_MELHA
MEGPFYWNKYGNLQTNSFNDEIIVDDCPVQFNRKRIRTLERNSLSEQFNLNTQLTKKLEVSNSEKFKMKEELAELSKIKEDYNNQLEIVKQLQLEKSQNEEKLKEEIKQYNSIFNQLENLKEENKFNFEELNKFKEECKKLNKELINSKDEINKLKMEELEKNKKFNNEIEVEQTNTSLNIKISELTSKLYEFSKIVYRYVPLPNKINAISEEKTCCEKKCINGDLSNGTCISNNGYVNVQGGWKVKYYSTEKKDNIIRLYAEQSFKKDAGYDSHYSLFYYEITMIKDAKINGCALIGFEDVVKIVMDNTSREHKGFQKIDWIDGDIFGCGLVFPPKTETKILPYSFNLVESIVCKGVAANLYPDVWLQSCSLEINFGNDLEKKPFYYNVSQHI